MFEFLQAPSSNIDSTLVLFSLELLLILLELLSFSLTCGASGEALSSPHAERRDIPTRVNTPKRLVHLTCLLFIFSPLVKNSTMEPTSSRKSVFDPQKKCGIESAHNSWGNDQVNLIVNRHKRPTPRGVSYGPIPWRWNFGRFSAVRIRANSKLCQCKYK